MFSRFMLILPLILIINIINHKGEKKKGGGGCYGYTPYKNLQFTYKYVFTTIT